MRRGFAFLTLAGAAGLALLYLGATFLAPRNRVDRIKSMNAAGRAAGEESPPVELGDAVQMLVKGVSLDPTTSAPMVVLVDMDERRILPIFIGPSEATSIARQLGQLSTPRPLTHDLILNIVGGLGAEVKRILISDMREGTYYAVLYLQNGGKEIPVDSRPSDAIAVALRAEAPIFVAQKVLLDSPPLSMEDLEILTGESGRGDYVPLIGAALQELTPDLAAALGYAGREGGALVAHVDRDGVSDEAGLDIGDLVIAVDGAAVADVTALRTAVRAHESGDVVITVLRDGKERQIRIEVE